LTIVWEGLGRSAEKEGEEFNSGTKKTKAARRELIT